MGWNMRGPGPASVQVDSILIDEARTPLIISGTADKPSDKYYKARLGPHLTTARALAGRAELCSGQGLAWMLAQLAP